MRMKKAFGNLLRGLRKKAFPKMSAAQYAESIGIEPPTYRTYERGEAEPGFENLTRICQSLGITPNDLLPEASGSPRSGLTVPSRPQTPASRTSRQG